MISGLSLQRWKKSDGIWLTLAVFAHALLLLIPLKGPDPHYHVQAPLTISLTAFPSVAAPRSHPVARNAPAAIVTTETFSTLMPLFVPIKPVSLTPKPSIIERPKENASLEVLTTAGLMDMARTMRLDHLTPASSPQLGVHVPQDPPYNWQPGAGARALQPEDNWFSGMSVPARTEIVDRWLAADGSHNVVVNLPNGQTICGRADSWNPLQPLVEHVMLFHLCGGGGNRRIGNHALDSASQLKAAWVNSLE